MALLAVMCARHWERLLNEYCFFLLLYDENSIELKEFCCVIFPIGDVYSLTSYSH